MIKKIVSILILFFCLMAILASLLLTQAGLKAAIFITNQLTTGQIQYEQVTGLLTGPIYFHNLTYTDHNKKISIKTLDFDWKLSDLVQGRLTIDYLHANHINVAINKSSATTTATHPRPTKSQTNDYYLHIHNAYLQNINFISNEKRKAHINSLHIRADVSPNNFNVNINDTWSKPFKINNHIRIKGTLSNYSILINSQLPQHQLTIKGHGDSQGLQLSTAKGVNNLPISSQITLTWAPKISWNIQLAGHNIKFGTSKKNFPIIKTLDLISSGKVKNTTVNFTARANIQTEKDHITLTAKHDTTWLAKWNIEIHHPHKLINLIPFKLTTISSEGSFEGTPTNPKSQGKLKITSLQYNGSHLDTLTSQWNILSTNNPLSYIKLNAHNISINKTNLTTLSINTQGTLIHHLIEIHTDIENTPIKAVLFGHYSSHSWSTQLERLAIKLNPTNNFKLAHPVNIHINDNQPIKVPNLCLNGPTKQQLCVNFEWNNHNWQGSLQAQHFKLNTLLTRYINKFKFTSTSNLSASFSGTTNQLKNAKMNIQINPGLIISTKSNKPIPGNILTSTINLKLHKQKIDSYINVKLSNGGYIQGQLTTNSLNLTSPINGILKIHLNQIEPLLNSLPYIKTQQAGIAGDLAITGTLNQPLFNGQFNLHSQDLYIDYLQTTLRDIKLKITANKNIIKSQLSALSLKSPITINATTELNQAGVTSHLQLTGNNILVINTPKYQIYADAQLKAKVKNYHININGNITIPKAHFNINLASSVVSLPSQDIIITGQTTDKKSQPWSTSMHVNVTVGDKVYISIIGIKAQLTGSLKISKKNMQPSIGNGVISVVKGEYKAYGHTLKVEPSSSLTFINSPINNPEINVLATKTIGNTTASENLNTLNNQIIVGLRLSGLLKQHPKISLFSQPDTLSNAEILSYLFLGTTSTDNIKEGSSGKQPLNNIINAINALKVSETALTNYGGFIQQLQNSLGLSELGVEQNQSIDAIGNSLEQQTTSIVVGKYLLPNKLYLRYSRDYFNSTNVNNPINDTYNQFQLRYIINKNWNIKFTATTDGGPTSSANFIQSNMQNPYAVDLIYNFSRN